MSQLDNQIALVTGAGRGIGQAIALKLAGAGADIVAVDLQAEFCNETAQKVQALGRKTWCFAADVANAASVEALAGQVFASAGRVDILVNNAGITRDMLLMRTPHHFLSRGGEPSVGIVFGRDVLEWEREVAEVLRRDVARGDRDPYPYGRHEDNQHTDANQNDLCPA